MRRKAVRMKRMAAPKMVSRKRKRKQGRRYSPPLVSRISSAKGSIDSARLI